jgi:uncharacterized protein (TIGR03437 family)
VDSFTLTFTATAADLASPGLAEVVASTPPLGGGVSLPIYFAITVSLPLNHVVYDRGRNLLWGSVAATGPAEYRNSVVSVDPETGATGKPIAVASQANQIAISDDGSFLYAGLDDMSAVQRVNLVTAAPELQFSLGGKTFAGAPVASSIQVVAGSPHTVVVLTSYGYQVGSALAVYDDGVSRPATAGIASGNLIPTSDASLYYAFGNSALAAIRINDRGAQQSPVTLQNNNSSGGVFLNGKLYGNNGAVIDPVAGVVLGYCTSIGGNTPTGVAADATGLAYFIKAQYPANSGTVSSCDTKTYAQIAQISIPAASPGQNLSFSAVDLIRWGPDGLAFLAGTQLFILRMPIVSVPVYSSAGLVNGASFAAGPVAPGQIASLFGSGLSLRSASANGIPLPLSLAQVSATLGGLATPLIYVSPTQFNIQVPWEVAGKTTVPLSAGFSGASERTVTVSVAPYNPGIFTVGSATGSAPAQGAVLIGNTSILAAPPGTVPGSRPAQLGEVISIYCTGLGDVTNVPPTGQASPTGDGVAITKAIPAVTIGGQPANVLFSGLAPGLVGIYQVNVSIPPEVAIGDSVPVSMQIGGTNSNIVAIAVGSR